MFRKFNSFIRNRVIREILLNDYLADDLFIPHLPHNEAEAPPDNAVPSPSPQKI